MGTLRDFIYKQLHYYIYLLIEYKESEGDFLKRAHTINEDLFNFLYMEKIEQFINVHYNHQSEYLLLLYFNFKSHFFVHFIMYSITFYYIFYQNIISFKYFYNL